MTILHVFLTRDFSCYMPELIELEVQPQPQKSAKGMKFHFSSTTVQCRKRANIQSMSTVKTDFGHFVTEMVPKDSSSRGI